MLPANEIQQAIELRFDFCIPLHSVHQAQQDSFICLSTQAGSTQSQLSGSVGSGARRRRPARQRPPLPGPGGRGGGEAGEGHRGPKSHSVCGGQGGSVPSESWALGARGPNLSLEPLAAHGATARQPSQPAALPDRGLVRAAETQAGPGPPGILSLTE